jgi:Protein of unknown function (DUF2615)
VCTDNECTDLVSPQNASTGGEVTENFTWMMFAMIAAVILYLIRPSSLRRRNDDLNKPSRDDVSLLRKLIVITLNLKNIANYSNFKNCLLVFDFISSKASVKF